MKPVFITVTTPQGGITYHVNPALINYMYRGKGDKTTVIRFGEGNSITVKETPDEIVTLIAGINQ